MNHKIALRSRLQPGFKACHPKRVPKGIGFARVSGLIFPMLAYLIRLSRHHFAAVAVSWHDLIPKGYLTRLCTFLQALSPHWALIFVLIALDGVLSLSCAIKTKLKAH
jgi:hypothetical protein